MAGGWKTSLAAALLTLVPHAAWAQCAMCARALQSEEGRQMISAFRGGILLMLVVPFALVAIVGTLAARRFRSVPYNRLPEIKEAADGADFTPRHSGGNPFAAGLKPAPIRQTMDALLQIHERLTQTGESYWAEQVEIQRRIASAWLAQVEGRTDDALAGMRVAAEREDATEKNAVTPGPLAPARELLGEMLLEVKEPGAAQPFRAAQRLSRPRAVCRSL
ncbi:MAG: hypothetical protein HY048_07100 [Acidobacteria bacterium]|nr:hypothetical protein [Acidobacteriota bacterium]